MKKYKTALLIVAALILGAASQHVRVKGGDSLWSVCYSWPGKSYSNRLENITPTDSIGPSTVMKIAFAQDLTKASGSMISSVNILTMRTGPRIGLIIKNTGIAELLDRAGNTMAILHRDGFVEYKTGHNEVVHALADLSASIASQKYNRWQDTIREDGEK